MKPPQAGSTGAIVADGRMADRIRAFDWSATSLGARVSWPDRLIAAVETMLASRQLTTLAVGRDRIFLYNDEAAGHYGDQHPDVLGLSLDQAFPHEFAAVAPFYDRVFAGEGLYVPTQSLDPGRTGTTEVFAAYLTPVRDTDGTVIAAHMTGSAIGSMQRSEEERRACLERRIDAATAALRASHDLMRGTIDSSNDMIQVFEAVRDRTGAIVDFRWILNNRTSELRFGDVTGQSLLARNPGVVAMGIFDTFRRVTETGVPEQAERHYTHEQFDGWFFQSVVKLRDGVATTTKAIDEWKAAQAEIMRLQREAAENRLSESEGRFRTLADAAPAMIWRNDADGGNLFVNRYLLDYTGRAAPDVAGSAWHTLVHPDQAEAWVASYMAAVRDRLPWQNRTMVRRHDGAWRWFDNFAQPLLTRDGRYLGHAGVSIDVHSTVEAEVALRRSEERLRQFGEASQDILWLRDAATLQWVYLTPAFEPIYGLTCDEALSGDTYANWRNLIVPEDRDHAIAATDRVRGGEHVTFEYRIRRPSDGTIRWVRDTDFPIVDDAGRVVLIGGIGRDFTDVRETELRFRTLVEGMPQLVWRAVEGGKWTWASPQWTECTGQDEAEYRGWGWLNALHPDDRATARAAWSHALEHGGFEVEYRLRRHRDGAYRWFQTRAAPVRDDAGTIVEWLGTSTDVHELHQLQGLQATLLAELQHRVRNILAVTRSIISRSDDGERSIEDYIQHLQGRISTLARTQVLLTRRAGAQIDLEDMIRDELLAQVADDDQFVLTGPDIELSPKAAEVLTLAIHELATNATKYGAFTRKRGRLDVRWTVEPRAGERWLILDWVESGVPIVDVAPRHRGFGAELISRRIPYELKGVGRFELMPGGLRSRIEFPLVAGDSILQTHGAAL